VNNTLLFGEAVNAAIEAWEIQPVRGVRMPVIDNQRTVTTTSVDALWTDRGLRPNASNLAFLIQDIANLDELEIWKYRLKTLPVRASLLISGNEFHLLHAHADNGLELQRLNIDTWRETLVSPKSYLFKPKEIAKLKSGQLSLADLEETVVEGSFNFLLREQQKKIEEAFLQGIEDALKFVDSPNDSISSRAEVKGHVIRFAIAYLAARILEDKNFFDVQIEDPIQLLDRIGKIRNGFFKRARASADYVPIEARQALVHRMGYQVSFVLADHRDVGRLYERAIKHLKEQNQELDNENWGDLKQHYTPVAIAERILAALPLERLHPSERVIFDPAAGSGSLLLAATSRLAGMTDVSQEERDLYLRTHVMGNDWDEYASWIAQLRYFLASESLGNADEPCQISEILPFPEIFTRLNYNDLEMEEFPIKPRVIIANPPFEEKGSIQEAAQFVDRALSWMEAGSQFAFVLPQSFLTNTTHGIKNVRDLLCKCCHILEVWQFPEGIIGTNARQSTCIILGIINTDKIKKCTISRGVFSASGIEDIREKGFLGNTWIVNLNLLNLTKITAPPIQITVPTFSLGNLFYVFTGVNPGSLGKTYQPIKAPISGVNCKRYWRLSWKGKNRLWANPSNVIDEQKWIRYGSDFLEGSRLDKEELFDSIKLLVGRKVNRNSSEPLVVRLDTSGFCPNNDVYCVLHVDQVKKYNKEYEERNMPENKSDFNIEDQILWLLGLLSSDLLNALSLIGRNSREMAKKTFLDLPFVNSNLKCNA
jgi:N-6 DNA Methylase